MTAYIVRLKENKELVGIFCSDNDVADLGFMVDECVAPCLCEYRVIEDGGIFWPASGAVTLPRPVAAEDGDEDDPTIAGASFTASWYDATYEDDDEESYEPVFCEICELATHANFMERAGVSIDIAVHRRRKGPKP